VTEVSDDDVEYTTVADENHFDEEYQKALVEVADAQVVHRQKRTKTYLTSEIPVRPCTDSCTLRARCKDFQSGRVADNELCRPELRRIKKWQVAFRKGELDALKDDVGTVAGSMAVQVGRLLEAVNADGAVIEVDKYSASGDHYTEKVAHPALSQAANLMKTLGIDLGEFLMTPKSQKDGPPQVQVNIGVSADEVHARFAARFSDGAKAADP